MIYLVLFLLLIALMNVYFWLGRKYGIVAHVNERSSHKKPVITGAGIIFVVSYLFYLLYAVVVGIEVNWLISISALMIALVSFFDDIKEIWFFFRLCFQMVAVLLLMWQLKLDFSISFLGLKMLDWIAFSFLLILFVGAVNLYNFIDGINGLIGGLSLVFFISVIFLDVYVVDFIKNIEKIYFLIVPTLVFLIYNFRKNPVCFCGDVGSIFLGMIVVYLLSLLIIRTDNFTYILLFSIIIIEAGYTVIQRLLMGQNIFKPHRIHLFQLLCNQYGHSHLKVTSIYVFIQTILALFVVLANYYEMSLSWQYSIGGTVFFMLSLLYVLYKRELQGGHLLEDGKPIRKLRKMVYKKESNKKHIK
jgi:UDP-N-acetylmuramyl pentapeptide phosphotransferase/UDP-N-acetylglucosamine-1-phosphate transferase